MYNSNYPEKPTNKGKEGTINGINNIMAETMQDYLNFPDPQLYLVGFESIDPS